MQPVSWHYFPATPQDQLTLGALLETVTFYMYNLSFGNDFFFPQITCSHVCPMEFQAVSVDKKLLEQQWLVLCRQAQVRLHVEHGSGHHTVRHIRTWNHLQERTNKLLKTPTLRLRMAFQAFLIQPWP